MWLKFCGITRAEDFQLATELGAHAIGIIIVPGTPRCVELAQLAKLTEIPRKGAQVVLVVQDQPHAEIAQAIRILRPDMLQFHGRESVEFASGFELPYIKAQRVRHDSDLEQLSPHASAWAWLVDRQPDAATRGFEPAAHHPQHRIIEAGGLTPETVSERMRQVQPFGVDVSSGVESSPGIKDPSKMSQFAERVREFEIV